MNLIIAQTHPATVEFYDLYAASLRSILFSGLLTLSSFLLAATTFIVIQLKKELYDHEEYKKKLLANRALGGVVTHYGPLRRLARVLVASIVMALVAAISQVTLGIFWKSCLSAAICLALALVAITFLAASLVLLILNLRNWFDFMEQSSPTKQS